MINACRDVSFSPGRTPADWSSASGQTEEAMATYFAGQTRWDAVHLRFETFSATHGLYWFWWERGRRVGVISCFRLDEDDADD